MGARNVLALNSGSSSLKFGLYRVDSAKVERLLVETVSTADDPDAIAQVTRVPKASGLPPPDAIGHRIVHGGPALREHCRIDDAVLRRRQAAAAFAPLHVPAALLLIEFAQVHFPGVTQVACDAARLEALILRASNPLSDGASRCRVQISASREDEQIARHTQHLLG